MTSPQTSHPLAEQHGFTLLESLLVLAILALVTAGSLYLAKPRNSAMPLQTAAREIAAHLRATRSLAISRNTEAVFSMDLAKRHFWSEASGKKRAFSRDLNVRLISAKSRVPEKGIGRIVFFPGGGSTGGEIILKQGPQKLTVRADWLTGRVSIDKTDSSGPTD